MKEREGEWNERKKGEGENERVPGFKPPPDPPQARSYNYMGKKE